MNRLRPTALAASLASLTLVGALAGCGSDDASSGPDGMDGMESMDGMDMSEMNQPDATPADEVDGDVTEGAFALLDTAPPGSEDVVGQAWLAQNDDGTTVTIRLSGLEPGVEYVSHLHAQSCAEDNGGEHFAFDPEGEEVPPNEVHLGFTADQDGTGEATVTNDRRVEDLAPAVIVHPADSMDNRLVCADFGS